MLEEQGNSSIHDITTQAFAWQKPLAKSSQKYIWGSVLGVVFLIAQVNYFLAYFLTQKPQVRPYLISASQLFKQTLPVYQNISDFTIIGSDLSNTKNKQYRVKISFINHANFPQQPPQLLLTLRNIQGGILSQRLFSSETYQNSAAANSLIAPNELFTIDIPISVPKHPISGYSIALK